MLILTDPPCNAYKCPNKKCIPLYKVCDGRNDCGDEDDERDCKKSGKCSKSLFLNFKGVFITGNFNLTKSIL